MNVFDNYVVNWYKEVMHTTPNSELIEFMELGDTVRITGNSEREVLMECAQEKYAGYIYTHLIANGKTISPEDFLRYVFEQEFDGLIQEYEFIPAFLSNMAFEAAHYNSANPRDFFDDLGAHGCVSGVVGMVAYHDNNRKIYMQYLDDLEDFLADFEEAVGEPVRNEKRLPRYTFVVWFCYQELAYQLEQRLWETEAETEE